ncbi:MAG: deoxyribonuclease IV [Acidimicrobiia bacterium]|nr:deoxyribonuclease IV [Acidimicrobiia bacterium]
MSVGAHVPAGDPVGEAESRHADLAQFFLGNPQSWKTPPPRDDADALRNAGMPLYVHANYLINVGSDNNRIRIPSRKNLADVVAGAEAIGARGVIVHGGHVGDDEDAATGVDRWAKALEPIESKVMILIENTAGGGNAIARELDSYAPLWEAIGDFNVGVCLDTCHAWAAGEEMETAVARLRDATGRLDIVHCNNSRDPHDSRRDRHANLADGEIPEDVLIAIVEEAGAPVVVETPGGAEEQGADIAWLRERIA